MTYGKPARKKTRRVPRVIVVRRLVLISAGMFAAICLVLLAACAGGKATTTMGSNAPAPVTAPVITQSSAPPSTTPQGSSSTAAHGQAAVQVGESQIQASPNQHVAPIASVAKVMTAYLVLRDHPLGPGEDGPTITLTETDVADTERRSLKHESIVPIAAGERLTELEALEALLLPSANNIAAVLARWDAGSEDRFVARMNATARLLGMTHTRYTDPSGYDDTTVSTAADQMLIVDRATRLAVFKSIVATPSARLPVAGTVYNTNTLLGRGGFIGVKTGSDEAAGGCFAFRAIRWIDGKQTTITGVVLGQPGQNQIAAALAAAAAMVDRIAGPVPARAMPGLQQ